jgi:hypothetical protein
VGNEENGYSFPNLNKTMINVTKESNETCIKTLKEETLEDITKKSLEKRLDIVNHNEQDALKKFQDTKNKEHEKAQKQISELRQDFNKHQSETKDTIKRGIYELKMTTQNIEEELNKEMDNLRKKNQTDMLGHSSRLEQVRDGSTWVVCVAIFNSTSKNALSSLLCLCLLFNKIRDKGRTGSAWKQDGGGRGRNDSNNIHTCE